MIGWHQEPNPVTRSFCASRSSPLLLTMHAVHIDNRQNLHRVPKIYALFYFLIILLKCCLQCLDAVGWAAGRASGLQKTEWWGAGMVICLKLGADLHTALLMPLPLTVSCFSKIQIGFTFLVPAHLGSPGQGAVKRVSVCVILLKINRF